MSRSLGVDGYARGWVAVEVVDGRFSSWAVAPTFADLVARFPKAEAIGVDIPIGLPAAPPRRADVEAARFLRAGRSTVFPTFPREVYETRDHAAAVVLCGERGWPGISRQSFGLGRRIAEVERARDARVFEVHPEVSFHELAGAVLGFSKHTRDGFMIRRRLLQQAIDLPGELGRAPLVDVLDAAAAAWSADRRARDVALPLPGDPSEGEPTIWR